MTTTRPTTVRFAASACIALLLAVAISVCARGAYCAAETSASTTHVFHLDYAETMQDYLVSVSNQAQDALVSVGDFKKRPKELGSRRPQVGVLTFSSPFISDERSDTRPGRRLAYMYDSTSRTLYLDLNANLDLTDDTSGVVSIPTTETLYQRVQFTSAGLSRPCLLSFQAGGSSWWARCYSYWKGTVELDGKRWRMSVADPFCASFGSASVALEPDDNTTSGCPGFIRYLPTSSGISVGGNPYALSLAIDYSGTTPTLVATFTEMRIPPPTGEVELVGEKIGLAVFDAPEAFDTVVGRPAGRFRVPANQKLSMRLVLDSRTTSAPGGFWGWKELEPLKPGEFRRIRAGAPLHSEVKVSQHGQNALLDYALLGQGGEYYLPYGKAWISKPQYTIRRGEKLLTRGEFEFG